MRSPLKKNFLYLTVFVISILLGANIVLTYYNHSIIKRNRELQKEVIIAKAYYDQIGKSVIHSLDIGLRGFAIVSKPKFADPMYKARDWKDSIVSNTEAPLQRLGYDFSRYTIFRDSLDSYVRYCFRLERLLAEGHYEEFRNIFATDKGAHLWWQYLETEKDILRYVNRIDQEAQSRYETALFTNGLLQVLLFLICVPTLLFTAIYTMRTFRLTDLLRRAQQEKNKILREQNVALEHRVVERTHEIIAQNEEISSQSEELSAQRDTLLIQNQQLQEAGELIKKQNEEIHSMNQHLKKEVDSRTQQLQNANRELIEQNTQLEQFAFIAAHNLRAPLARILGLTYLMKIGETEKDRQLAFEKLEDSAQDMDHVIRDLNSILNIQKHTGNLVEVSLDESLARTQRILEKEIHDTGTRIEADLHKAHYVFAVAPYVDSILFNLLSNAIKYRDPERQPIISVETLPEGEFVCLAVKDNGLGIDLAKYKSSMFNLYKRFHLHTEGKGLGLYLVKTQIEALGGKIDVMSQPGRGTTFLVYFRREKI